ncbi:hypothetical protein CHS0354_019269 [Potamilus streckersoni]|uniref:Uncharacterized protein n=1 Tax=Potamilus streckersoni TaxID=2493646 RepID=A0AAE0RLV4_9BIVA|nr:hypothetical protein CHS0354_019269 [Potamilus streckersoni]
MASVKEDVNTSRLIEMHKTGTSLLKELLRHLNVVRMSELEIRQEISALKNKVQRNLDKAEQNAMKLCREMVHRSEADIKKRMMDIETHQEKYSKQIFKFEIKIEDMQTRSLVSADRIAESDLLQTDRLIKETGLYTRRLVSKLLFIPYDVVQNFVEQVSSLGEIRLADPDKTVTSESSLNSFHSSTDEINGPCQNETQSVIPTNISRALEESSKSTQSAREDLGNDDKVTHKLVTSARMLPSAVTLNESNGEPDSGRKRIYGTSCRRDTLVTKKEEPTNKHSVEKFAISVDVNYSAGPDRGHWIKRTDIIQPAYPSTSIFSSSRPCFNAACFLSDGSIMLLYCNDHTCCLFDSEFKYITEFRLSNRPESIRVVGEKEVAVTLPEDHIIQLLATSSPIKPTRAIKTKRICLDVASINRNEFIISGKTYWSIVSTDNIEKSFNPIPGDISESSNTSVALDRFKTRVYITVDDQKSLYCYSLDGQILFLYSHKELQCPSGVAVANNDTIYVVGRWSHNLHQISPDGDFLQVTKADIPINPLDICFNTLGNKFLIINGSMKDRHKLYLFETC